MENQNRLTDVAAHALLDRLFPLGVAGPDVLAELAPAGWDQSPLLACFHPSADQRREESRQFERNLQRLRALMSRRTGTEGAEIAELIGMCLWDVFSDNHEVVTADGRVADIGSFRGASAFLDEHLTTTVTDAWAVGDYLRVYMGTAWIAQRADLEPVYAMIFRRLRACGADWVYHFPRLYLVDLGRRQETGEQRRTYSPNEAIADERAEAAREAEISRTRAELDEANDRAREAAMDRRPPTIVIAYRSAFGRNPRGWPPAS